MGMALSVLSYTAQITLPSGQLYSYVGTQSVTTTTSANIAAAALAMGADISNQLVTGTAADPSLAAQQSTDSTQA